MGNGVLRCSNVAFMALQSEAHSNSEVLERYQIS